MGKTVKTSRRHSSRKQAKTSKTNVLLRGFALEKTRDAAGFDTGVIINKAWHQISVGLVVDQQEPTFAELDQWLAYIATLDEIEACAVIQDFNETLPTRALVTYRVAGIKDLRSAKNMLNDRLPGLYAPKHLSIDWAPLDAEAVTLIANSFWSPGAPAQFPPAGEVNFELQSINNQGRVAASFEIDTAGVAGQEIFDEIQAVLTSLVPLPASLIQVFRPTDHEYRDQHPDTRPGRSFALLTVFGDTPDEVEQIMTVIFQAVSAFSRLRIHRLYGRHHLGVLLTAGIPFWGWKDQKHVVVKK